MKVLFLTLYPETMPSSRLRVFQYLPYLKRAGIEATVLPSIPEPWFSRWYYSSSKWIHWIQYSAEALTNLNRLHQSRKYDVVFIQKGLLSTNFRGFDRLLERVHDSLIFDLDDLVYGRNLIEFRAPFFRLLQDPDQTKKISSRCRAIVAGNPYLRELALQYNRNVYLLPTPVDSDRFRPFKKENREDRKDIIIGWMGVEATLSYVRSLEEVFQKLSRKYRVRLRIITRPGREPFRFDGVPVELRRWSYEEEVNQLADLDIGIAPLEGNVWDKGKCGLKLLQYMSMGLPSVSSRIGSHCDIVKDGVDGFLASSADEWIEKLSLLIEDEETRRKMGNAAREKIVEGYSLEKTAPHLIEILETVGNRISDHVKV